MPYWVPEQLDETLALHQAVLDGKAPPDGFEITLQRKDGERFQALIYEAPLIDGNGQHTGWMASILDVTERRRAEELARQQQEKLQFTSRLVTMGEMASTLAHELNQPLAAIASYNTGCLNLLAGRRLRPAGHPPGARKTWRPGPARRPHHPPCARLRAGRASRSARRVRSPRSSTTASASSRPRRASAACSIATDLPPLPPVLADRLMLEQVLLNLIRNGMEAMAATPAGAAGPARFRPAPLASEVVVSIADNGCGIAPEVREKLFTAFFSTKPEGMGIGLSICRSIIEFHRGRLWVEDNALAPGGSGTIFTFTLPLESA